MPYSFKPIISSDSQTLILGSLPSIISLREQQYYANPHNHFWNIIYSVLDKEIDYDYEYRKKFLLENKIALWDIISYADREGSLDSSIRNVIPNEVPNLLAEYPNIKVIILNGTATEKYFKKYFNHLYECKKCVRVSSSSPIPGQNVKQLSDKKVEWKNALNIKE